MEEIAVAAENKKNVNYSGQCEFPKGDDFYIKSATSPSGLSSTSSIQNTVFDVERGFFVAWGAVKDGTKVIIAPQKSTTEHDGYQLWHYEDGFLVNKQTTLCLEPESVINGYLPGKFLTMTSYLSIVKAGSRLVLHHRRSGSQTAQQKW
ncbi:10992_t:CDS:2, partial [Dentiscutata erythropus]